jgi:hypothetical protein
MHLDSPHLDPLPRGEEAEIEFPRPMGGGQGEGTRLPHEKEEVTAVLLFALELGLPLLEKGLHAFRAILR